MYLKPSSKILFIGDSITDAGRSREDDTQLGSGFVNLLNAELRFLYPKHDLMILNRGNSGNRVLDLRNRWSTDCLHLQPDFLTVFIGINDTWRRYDSQDPTSPEDFEKNYRFILEETKATTNARLILMEPFVLPTPPDRVVWREDLDPRIHVTRRLASEFEAALIPLDGLFAAASSLNNPEYWARDGVHPTPAGHALIAHHWLKTFQKMIRE